LSIPAQAKEERERKKERKRERGSGRERERERERDVWCARTAGSSGERNRAKELLWSPRNN